MNIIEGIPNEQINGLLPTYMKRFGYKNSDNHYICPICNESMFYDEQHNYIECLNCGCIHSLYDIAKQHFSIRNGVSIPHHLDAKRIINIVMNNNGKQIKLDNFRLKKFDYPGLYNPNTIDNSFPKLEKNTSIFIGYGFKKSNELNKIFKTYNIRNYLFISMLENKPLFSIIKFLLDNKCYNKRIYLFFDSTQEHIKTQLESMLKKYHFNLVASSNLTTQHKTFKNEFIMNEFGLKQRMFNYLDNFNTFKTTSKTGNTTAFHCFVGKNPTKATKPVRMPETAIL